MCDNEGISIADAPLKIKQKQIYYIIHTSILFYLNYLYTESFYDDSVHIQFQISW